ncbi:MAG: hypothetical protein ACYTBJ_17290 [Planctomycetota bacterium]|jgi:hypothetical protein
MKLQATPAQWVALQRGEEVEILERMEPPPNYSELSHVDTVHKMAVFYDLMPEGEQRIFFPYSPGDRIALVCPELNPPIGCYPFSEPRCEDMQCKKRLTAHSITARQVGGEWFWALGVKKEDA